MGANTAQREKERRGRWADKFVALAIRGVLPLIEGGKRDGEAILKLLQVIKDGGEEYQQLFAFINAWKQDKVIDLAEFFKTREGLWVSEAFHNRILAPALKKPTTTRASVGKPFNLPKDMIDAEIRAELGDHFVFEDPYAFLAMLADTIELQWGGTDGDLLSNGCVNIFYVRGLGGELFAVNAYWDADDREWCVSSYRLDGRQWYVGSRAFPRGK